MNYLNYCSSFKLRQAPRHLPLVADLLLPIVEAAVHRQIAAYAIAERRAVPLWPDLEISDTHPAQKFPTCQVDTGQIQVEEHERSNEYCEAGDNQEREKHKNLVIVYEPRFVFAVPQDNPNTHEQPRQQL